MQMHLISLRINMIHMEDRNNIHARAPPLASSIPGVSTHLKNPEAMLRILERERTCLGVHSIFRAASVGKPWSGDHKSGQHHALILLLQCCTFHTWTMPKGSIIALPPTENLPLGGKGQGVAHTSCHGHHLHT